MALFAARHFALKIAHENKNAVHDKVKTSQETVNKTAKQTKGHGLQGVDVDLGSKGIPDIEVIAVPCVGDSQYLMKQMRDLDLNSGCRNIFPTILKTDAERNVNFKESLSDSSSPYSKALDTDLNSNLIGIKKVEERVFGKPYKEHYQIWCDLKENMNIEFDLIYTPRTFEMLLKSFENDYELWNNCNILYYHCGGVEGNESQLGRYRFQKII